MKNIVLVGFMGTGKTAAAKALAHETGKKYVSTDELIEEHEGKAISDIFKEKGEPYFRRVEKEVLKGVMEGTDQIVDAGGGVVLDDENIKNIKKNGVMICLWASPEVIYKRTKRHTHRPLLNVEDPRKKIKEILNFRKPFYDKADFHIETRSMDIKEVVGEIIKIMKGMNEYDTNQ